MATALSAIKKRPGTLMFGLMAVVIGSLFLSMGIAMRSSLAVIEFAISAVSLAAYFFAKKVNWPRAELVHIVPFALFGAVLIYAWSDPHVMRHVPPAWLSYFIGIMAIRTFYDEGIKGPTKFETRPFKEVHSMALCAVAIAMVVSFPLLSKVSGLIAAVLWLSQLLLTFINTPQKVPARIVVALSLLDAPFLFLQMNGKLALPFFFTLGTISFSYYEWRHHAPYAPGEWDMPA